MHRQPSRAGPKPPLATGTARRPPANSTPTSGARNYFSLYLSTINLSWALEGNPQPWVFSPTLPPTFPP